ncbi:MAG TPA: glycosyltransferase family 39 protein [Acidimicrobiales bacterium]|nr:glycosyltransferase family 39 protein [Acidimicrobiales bacterium]
MAMQILGGHSYTFFWGGTYGGVEPYLMAPLLWLFGPNPAAVNATPALLGAAMAVVVWRTARHLVRSPGAAALAGAVVWVWPEPITWLSTRETGFHEAGLLLGVLLVFWAVRIATASRRRLGDWAALGATFGLGWWASPEIVYFAVPAAVLIAASLWRAVRHRDVATWAGVALAEAASFGAGLPWIYTNVHTHLASLHHSPAPYGYWYRFGVFWSEDLPILLGLRVQGGGSWVVGAGLGVALCIVAGSVLVACAVLLWKRRPPARAVVLGLAAFPFIFAAFPTNGFWHDARYAAPLGPLAVLVLVGGLAEGAALPVLTNGQRRVGLGLLGAALALLVVVPFDLSQGGGLASSRLVTALGPDPDAGTRQVVATLEALRVRYAYGTYWIAYDVMFLSDRRVTMTEIDDVRWRGAWDAVNAAPSPAWVFPDPQVLGAATAEFGVTDFGYPEAALLGYLADHRIGYSLHRAGLVDVIQPWRRVTAADVGAHPVFVWDPVLASRA